MVAARLSAALACLRNLVLSEKRSDRVDIGERGGTYRHAVVLIVNHE